MKLDLFDKFEASTHFQTVRNANRIKQKQKTNKQKN